MGHLWTKPGRSSTKQAEGGHLTVVVTTNSHTNRRATLQLRVCVNGQGRLRTTACAVITLKRYTLALLERRGDGRPLIATGGHESKFENGFWREGFTFSPPSLGGFNIISRRLAPRWSSNHQDEVVSERQKACVLCWHPCYSKHHNLTVCLPHIAETKFGKGCGTGRPSLKLRKEVQLGYAVPARVRPQNGIHANTTCPTHRPTPCPTTLLRHTQHVRRHEA
jgi:hypothetical protein